MTFEKLMEIKLENMRHGQPESEVIAEIKELVEQARTEGREEYRQRVLDLVGRWVEE